MIRLLALMIAYLLNGCVSIKTHETAKIESFQAGEKDMAQRCLHDLEIMDKDDIVFVLKGFLDVHQ